MLWIFALGVMGLLSVIAAAVVVILADLGFAAIFGMSGMMFVVIGVTFLLAVWLTAWLSEPRVTRARQQHQGKLLRHQVRALQKTIAEQERQLAQLRAELEGQRGASAVGSSTRQTGTMLAARRTGTHRRVETRELQQKTGSYQLISTPTYTPHQPSAAAYRSGEHPAAREVREYRVTGDTGAHPVHEEAHQGPRRPPTLPGKGS